MTYDSFRNRHFSPDSCKSVECYKDWWECNPDRSGSNLQTFINNESSDAFQLYFNPRDLKLYFTCKVPVEVCRMFVDDLGEEMLHAEISESYFLLKQTFHSKLTSNYQALTSNLWHFSGLFSEFPSFLRDDLLLHSDISIIENWFIKFNPVGDVMISSEY